MKAKWNYFQGGGREMLLMPESESEWSDLSHWALHEFWRFEDSEDREVNLSIAPYDPIGEEEKERRVKRYLYNLSPEAMQRLHIQFTPETRIEGSETNLKT